VLVRARALSLHIDGITQHIYLCSKPRLTYVDVSEKELHSLKEGCLMSRAG